MKNLSVRILAYSAVFVLLFAGVAIAQQPATASAAEVVLNIKTDGSIWKGILNGAIAGVFAAFLGWIKNRNSQTGEMERFQIKYLVPTAIVGVLVGIVAALMKKTPADLLTALETSPIYGGIVFIAEAGLKAIWRNSLPLIKDMISDVKTGTQNPTLPAPPKP